ncbi:phosphoglycerate mutase-like protein 1 isoform X1 [Camellia sinensis]|uniref:phosphoglycerate mutase-like protein 1 isoform X1 n=2 Tax=Camellia sinensis TaxID=4442 RepID=UPI001035BA03|nr:phosphoglycerate mutase-like protein 1 isoform X1 [Camellia sinensis]
MTLLTKFSSSNHFNNPSPFPPLLTTSTSSSFSISPKHHLHHRPSLLGATPPPVRLCVLCSSSPLSDMDSTGGLSLFPSHRCKTIHLVRHAQGIHNVEGEKDHSAYLSDELFDAHLTPLGWQQVDNLRKHVHTCGISKKVELVVTSPLLRTMQTAVGVFGGEGYMDGIDAPPLMMANTGKSSRPAFSSLSCPPFIAVELCREHLGVHPCDKRRSISEYKPLFPAIDFSLIENDADILWKPDIREKNEELAARGMKLLNCRLWTRKEKEIAVVTHSGFLIHTLSAFGNDCHPDIKSELCTPFNNCELRSVVIVDRSMIGSDSSNTNYPGKIPAGPDLPSDAAN